PTKALTFDVSYPPGASVDSIFNAATGIVGAAELFSVQHLGASNFQLTPHRQRRRPEHRWNHRSNRPRRTASHSHNTPLLAGLRQERSTGRCPIAPYGTFLDIRFGVYRHHPTLRTGTRNIRIKMKEAAPVPNFLRVSGHRATFHYRGLRRVCRRCQREGHIKVACHVPYFTRCAAFGHDSPGCAAGCGRCGAAHATVDCTQRRTYSSVAGQSLNEFPALALTPRDGPPATPSPAASNSTAPTPAVGTTESTVPSPSESSETTSPELDATTPQRTPATAMATAPTQPESPTAPEFQSSASLNWSDLTEGSDEERLVIHETAGDAAEGVETRSRPRYRERRRNASLESRRLHRCSRSRHGGAEEGKRVLSSSDEFATPQGIPPAAARLKRLRKDFSSPTGSPSSQQSSETPSD
ncbi:hypothetical protein HPB47_017750, partial [Ixodes persulcatus]